MPDKQILGKLRFFAGFYIPYIYKSRGTPEGGVPYDITS